MLKKIGTYLKEGFIYTSLEVTESELGKVYFLLELKKSKGELMVTKRQSLKGLEELAAHIKKKAPLLLCINTSDVLTKKIDAIDISEPEGIVNQAFPNLDLNSFYFEIAQQSTNPIISIARKETADALIKALRDLNIKVSGFSLGISAMEHVVPYMDRETIRVSNQQLQMSEAVITDVVFAEGNEEQEYSVNGLDLSSNYLLSFAQILKKLSGVSSSTNFEEVAQNLSWEFRNYRIFNQVLKYSLIFFFTLLFSNFFVYNFYHEEVAYLNTAMAATSSKKDELNLLSESVQRKQERVETLSSSSNSKSTYYLDLFAQHIPNSILLSEIKYQPLLKPVREQKPIILEERILLVSGISNDVKSYSFWVEELEKYDWIKSVETLDYDYISAKTSNFIIEIELHANQ